METQKTIPKVCEWCKKTVAEWWMVTLAHRPSGKGLQFYVCDDCKKDLMFEERKEVKENG